MPLLQWKIQATHDLIRIGRHIAKSSAANADRMLNLIENKVTQLATHPHIGRAGRQHGTYELVAHEHYIVVYRIRQTTVEILRVKHTARHWPAA